MVARRRWVNSSNARSITLHNLSRGTCFRPSTLQAKRMAKSRKQKFKLSAHTPYHRPSKTHDHAVKHAPKNQISGPQRQHQIPTIPFEPTHRILLVGEGDFSFAHSLYTSHHCENLTATCFDSATTLAEKYPQSTRHIQELENATSKDETVKAKILFGVDATKLGKGGLGSGGKEVKKGDFDRIVFNFPHVGGLTKDVNRQVRHNQGGHPPAIMRPNRSIGGLDISSNQASQNF